MSKKIGIASFWAIRIFLSLDLIYAAYSLIRWQHVSIHPLTYFAAIAALTYMFWIAKYTPPKQNNKESGDG